MRLVGFLQAWDLLRDELGREPTAEEFGARFNVTSRTVRDMLERFDYAFHGGSPGQILDLLWAWHASRLKPASGMPIGRG